LDSFRVASTTAGRELTFDNAATRLRIAQEVTYKARWAALDHTAGDQRPVGEESGFDPPRLPIPDSAWGPPDASGFRYAVASIKTISAGHTDWMMPVVVTVRERRGTVDIVGLERRI